MKKPPMIGTVWTAAAKIRMIDESTMKWVTLAVCIDTPNAIKAAIVAVKKSKPRATIWVHSDTNGKYIP